ncbi:MAG: glycosyltransferase [Deltaproteobacteria bacterium]|nr:glycosyltransferase [Deltaproteobacteria bacterium]TLN00981.1 MAG: glycosyltransferase [bacterium]
MDKALLIFAKQPLPGKVKTRLSPPFTFQAAADIYGCMLSDTLVKVAEVSGVERLLFFEPSCGAADFFRENFPGIRAFPQQGVGLGERLEKAFATAFSLGFESVVAIGTDSPDLPPSYLEESFRLLEAGGADAVFGPAADGGYYLVALKSYHLGIFRNIPWSTNQVLEKSLTAATLLGLQVACLPVWHDMDTVEDLKRFLAGGSSEYAPRTLRYLRENKI